MISSILLSVSSALLYGTSFPPFSLAPLAWIGLVPLIIAATRVTPARAFICGLVWAVVFTFVVGNALPGMVSNYFELPPWVGWATFLAVSLGLAGVYFGAFAAWTSWMARRAQATPFLIAAAWGVSEFARARLWVGNPWALSAYSQVGFSPIMQIADIAGPYGIGMLIAAVNATVASLFVPALRPRRAVVSAAAVVALLAATGSYGHWRLSQKFTTGTPVTVAAVQAAIQREFHWRAEYQQLGIAEYVTLTQKVAAARPDLIIWPEYAINFYLEERTPERALLMRASQRLGADLILGGPHYAFAGDATVYHNSVYLLRDARIAGRYDKMRLLPMAEDAMLGSLVGGESYAPGREADILRASAASVGAFLCFEAMYPEVVRRFVTAGADVLANLSNDDWFGSISAARHHLAMASVRSIENRRYLIRATSSGFSAIIDPHGHVEAISSFGVPDVLTTTIYRSTTRTFYQTWGDVVAWLAVATALAASFIRWQRAFCRPSHGGRLT